MVNNSFSIELSDIAPERQAKPFGLVEEHEPTPQQQYARDAYGEARQVIAALTLLFFNYTSTDTAHLCSVCGHEFAYLWDKYVEGHDNTHARFWEVYEQCDWKNKNRIIDRAMSRYSDEARPKANR